MTWCYRVKINRFPFFFFSKFDTLRDEFFTDRKERERIQAQRDEMKRELEAAQSRIASLQEQV